MEDFSLVFVNGQKNLYFHTRIWGVKNIQNLATKDTVVQETSNDIYPVTQLLSVKAGFEPSFNFEVGTVLQLASMLDPLLWKRK